VDSCNEESVGLKLFRELWTKRLGAETVERIIEECKKDEMRTDLFANDKYLREEAYDESKYAYDVDEDGYFSSAGDE
jgi:hypothetical protein